jgi:hypothetical protein
MSRRAITFLICLVAIAVATIGFVVSATSYSASSDPPESRGRAFVTTNSLGYVSIEHGLGVVPNGVVASGCGPTGGTPNIPSQVVTDTYTDHTFRARVIDPRGNAMVSLPVSVCWIAYAAGVVPSPVATTPTATATAPPPVCAPITITVGGTYSGCYQSSATGTPAVTIATAQPVTLSRATVVAKGYGLVDSVAGVRLTVLDSVFTQQNPGAVVDHRAVALTKGVAAVDIEHNSFSDGDGIWIASPTSSALTINGVKVDYNVATNIGRYPNPKDFGCCVQFLQFTQVTVPGAEVGWNKVTNIKGQSGVEDNINFYQAGGTPTNRTNVHHNLIDGAYPTTNNTSFTGGGINLGDAGDHDNYGHDNTVVSTTNYGMGLSAAGNYSANDLLVNDGAEQVSAFGQAVIAFQSVTPPGAHSTGDKYNWHRSTTDTTQYPCYQSQYCSGGILVTTTEQQARDAWETARVSASIIVGPR